MSGPKSAVCFLTRTPDAETVQFAEDLSQDRRISSKIDVCIMIDDNNYSIPSHPSVKFIQVNNNECLSNGFHSSNKLEMNKDCISWDKSLYYFCRVKQYEYSFVWLIEDDTFIPSVDAFVNLHEKYSKEGQGDLICQKNDENLYGDTSTWKWADVVGKFSTPWYHSMVCAIGCSRKLLNAIDQYARQRGFLPFIEYMFNTIAMQNRMKVVNPPELNTIVFRENWTMEHIRQRPQNWFHPMKNGQIRRENRFQLANGGYPLTGYSGSTWNTGDYNQAPPPPPLPMISMHTTSTPAYPGIQGPVYPGSQGSTYPIVPPAPYPPCQNPPYPGQGSSVQYAGQGGSVQYPYCPPPPPLSGGNVVSSLVYPMNPPPSYPPH